MNDKIEKYIEDIAKIYPRKIMLAKKELAHIRNTSESTINREIEAGIGIPFKRVNRRIMYPIRDIAEWLANTTKTY